MGVQRGCERCKSPISPARAKALPQTRLCLKCSNEVGSDFQVSSSPENLAKKDSLKKNWGGVNIQKKRRRIERKND